MRVGDDVYVLRRTDEPASVDGEAADDYVLDSAVLKKFQKRKWIKRLLHGGIPWRDGWRSGRALRPLGGSRRCLVRDRA
jgi:hypothetical protein